jgi:hypothetical protein
VHFDTARDLSSLRLRLSILNSGVREFETSISRNRFASYPYQYALGKKASFVKPCFYSVHVVDSEFWGFDYLPMDLTDKIW